MAQQYSGRTLGEPTAEQWQALQDYAEQHGRTWKAQLRDEWMNACQGISDLDQQALLQQVRNTFGPHWLMMIDIRQPR